MARKTDLAENKKRLRLFESILRQEGFDPKLDKDGSIKFKFEHLTHKLVLEENDPEYLKIVLSNFWKFDHPSEHLRALAGALHATATTKVAKISVIDDKVEAYVESFLGSPEHFRPVITRMLNALKSATNRFCEFAETYNTPIW